MIGKIQKCKAIWGKDDARRKQEKVEKDWSKQITDMQTSLRVKEGDWWWVRWDRNKYQWILLQVSLS